MSKLLTEMESDTNYTTEWVYYSLTENDKQLPNKTMDESIRNVTVPSSFQRRDDAWVIPLVTLSTINITAIIVFEIYVLYKSCGNRRHLFLGQVLLLGLFLCSVLGYAYIPLPSVFTCAVTRVGIGLSYVIVLSTLLVKLIFLTNLHNGVYLTTAYQGMLLFFIIAAQVPISSQWLVYKPPQLVRTMKNVFEPTVCNVTPTERIQYLTYAMFLLFLVIIASVKARLLKENNREALYIAVSTGIIFPMWVAWIAVTLIFDRRYEDVAEGFGVVCTATVTFLLVFVPKAVQLSSVSLRRKNGSTTGSHSIVYTPSFLHLQPQAILPGSTEGTLIKHPIVSKGPYQDHPLKFLRYDYATFQQKDPQAITSDKFRRKSDISSSYRSPLY